MFQIPKILPPIRLLALLHKVGAQGSRATEVFWGCREKNFAPPTQGLNQPRSDKACASKPVAGPDLGANLWLVMARTKPMQCTAAKARNSRNSPPIECSPDHLVPQHSCSGSYCFASCIQPKPIAPSQRTLWQTPHVPPVKLPPE